MGVRIDIAGASPDELQHGLDAAVDVFVSAGIAPQKAEEAHRARSGWELSTFKGVGPTDDIERLADLWLRADEAALDACCKGWSTRPPTARLSLLD